jgi:hypothetical protein
MTSPYPLTQTLKPTSEQLVIELNNARFTVPKTVALEGSILDTEEAHLDLTSILPRYLGSLRLELFTAYIAWLYTRDVTKLVKHENAAIRVTKATMLLQIGRTLKDEVFCGAMTKYLERLYEKYDGQFGPTPKPHREW